MRNRTLNRPHTHRMPQIKGQTEKSQRPQIHWTQHSDRTQIPPN